MSFFLVAAGTYRRSVCELFGVATVNYLSSVNHMQQTSLAEYLFSSGFDRLSVASSSGWLHSVLAHGVSSGQDRGVYAPPGVWVAIYV